MSNDTASGVVELAASQPFVHVIERLVQAIETAGMTIFARIDHAANAREVGLDMPPATVLIYGAPKGGTPIMLATPIVALDLPLRVLVRQDDHGRTLIAFHPIAAVLRNAGVPKDVAAQLEPAQQILLRAITP